LPGSSKITALTMLNAREYFLNTILSFSLLTYEQKRNNNASPNNMNVIIGFNKKQIAKARKLKTTNYIPLFCSIVPILFWQFV